MLARALRLRVPTVTSYERCRGGPRTLQKNVKLYLYYAEYPRPPFAVDASALKDRRRRADTGFLSRHCVQTTGPSGAGDARTRYELSDGAAEIDATAWRCCKEATKLRGMEALDLPHAHRGAKIRGAAFDGGRRRRRRPRGGPPKESAPVSDEQNVLI